MVFGHNKMAFSYTTTQRTVFGNEKVRRGTFQVTSNSTGGDVATGLKSCRFFSAQVLSTTTAAAKFAINETFPVAGGAITVVSDVASSTINGVWQAFGY